MLRIQVYRDGVLQDQIELREEDFPALVGRGEDARVRLEDPAVSRRHAQLSLADEQIVLTDLGSGNGTFVGGRPIRARVVEHRSDATLGCFKLLFDLESRRRITKPASPYGSVKDDSGGLTMKMAKAHMKEVTTRHVLERPASLVQVDPGRRIPLRGQCCFIGAAPTCDIILRGRGVALKHALVVKEGLTFRLHDLTGRQKTVVDGEPVDNVQLTPGMRFRIGRHEFRFEEEGQQEVLSDAYQEWFDV
jgi:pSer/pThr/pTyr-binding forkhead associated (FHA) protein